MLQAKVGYSKTLDAYEAGVETAKKASEGISPKIAFLFNSVGYDQKKLMEGAKSILKDTDIIGCTSSAGILVPDGYFVDETGTAEMLALDDADMTVACYGMPKGKSARETGREVALKALEKAGLDYAPDYFFMSASPKEEEEYIKGINIDWSALLQSVASFLTDGTKGVISGGIDAVSGIISGVTTFFIGFVFSIYVLFQKETLVRQLKKVMYALMPEQTNKKILEVMHIADTTFSNFLSGQCLEACILGSMFVISMTILRMPYAVLIGVLIAVTALIPIVGAFIGCIVGALLICMSNPLQALAFIILFLVLQQIEGNLIYPHVVGSSVGLPGIWVLVAVTVGGSLFGVAGMLTFIPLCSVAYALFRVYINRKADEKSVKNTEI